jgi:hypothetical protein
MMWELGLPEALTSFIVTFDGVVSILGIFELVATHGDECCKWLIRLPGLDTSATQAYSMACFWWEIFIVEEEVT